MTSTFPVDGCGGHLAVVAAGFVATMDMRIYGPRLTSGYTLGATSNINLTMSPALTDYRSARPVSADKQHRLYKANPTLAENGGAGPSRWSTTHSTLGTPHPDKPSVYHFRRPASAPVAKQKVLPYEQGSGPTLNNKYVPPTAGGPAGLRESEMVYDYSDGVDRKVHNALSGGSGVKTRWVSTSIGRRAQSATPPHRTCSCGTRQLVGSRLKTDWRQPRGYSLSTARGSTGHGPLVRAGLSASRRRR